MRRIRWGVVRRSLEAFLMRTRLGAQLLSSVMFAAAAYSGWLLAAELVRAATEAHAAVGAFDASRRVGDKAIAWATTLSVFYGVFLEERERLSRIWGVAEPDAEVAEAVHEVDARQGASLLCVGLLGEAVIGFMDLGRDATSSPALDAHALLCFFFVLALMWISGRHVRLHGVPRRGAPSLPALDGGGAVRNLAVPSHQDPDVHVTRAPPRPDGIASPPP